MNEGAAAALSSVQDPPEGIPGLWRWVLGALSASLVLIGLAIFITRLLTLASRLHANENFVGGIWIALARYAGHGLLYPPLYDGEHYAGTRYMPLPIVFHAAASQVSGEYLVSGRLLGVVWMAGLLVLLGLILVRIGLPWPLAAGLCALVLTTEVAWLGAKGLRFEALPSGLSLAALEIARSQTGRRWLALAATLCTAALFAKLSAVVAPIAILAWLIWRRREDVPPFLLVLFATSGLALAAGQLASGGRMLPVVSESILVQPATGGLLDGVSWLVWFAAKMANPALVLVPLALAGMLLAIARGRPSLYDIALGVALVVSIIVLRDSGAGYNHLLDVLVLLTICAAQLHVRARSERRGLDVVAPIALALAVSLVGVGWLAGHLPRAAAQWAAGREAPDAARLLAAELGPGLRILSEDPYVPVAMGQDPVVMDPYLLARLADAHPDWYGDLVARVERQEFVVVVLMRRLDTRAAPNRYGERIFGPGVYDALLRQYRFERVVSGRYHLYVPRQAGDTAEVEP
jgi:hypothetical protein